jgi:hypothetical protein
MIIRYWYLTEFCVSVNLPTLAHHVSVLMQCIISPIWGHADEIKQAVPPISHIRWYSPYCSHLHHPSLSFLSTALPSSQNTKMIHSSQSMHVVIMCCHCVQHTLTTAYTEYSIHRIQHTPNTAYTEYSIHRIQHTPNTAYSEHIIHSLQHPPAIVPLSFILISTSWLLSVDSVARVPSYTIDCHQPALLQTLKVKSPCLILMVGNQPTDE